MRNFSRRCIVASGLSIAALASLATRVCAENPVIQNPRQWADEFIGIFASRDTEKLFAFFAPEVRSDQEEMVSKMKQDVRRVFQLAGNQVRREFIANHAYGTIVQMFWYVVAFEHVVVFVRIQFVDYGDGWKFHNFSFNQNPTVIGVP